MRASPPPGDRTPLPTDASELPSLGSDADSALADGLRAMGLELSPGVLAAIDAHARLLAAWGRHVNLTADPRARRGHPPACARLAVGCRSGARTRRAGAIGGGHRERWRIPRGLRWGWPWGVGSISLVDSVGRKARFLEVAGAAVSAGVAGERALDVEVLPVRAEELAAGHRRAAWDLATLRAVGSVAECAELGLPLLRPGGLLVIWKRDAPVVEDEGTGAQLSTQDVASEVVSARPLIDVLGGGPPDVVDAGVPGAPGHRLVLVRKERPTPGWYPRLPAVRRGQPSRPAHDSGGRYASLLIV